MRISLKLCDHTRSSTRQLNEFGFIKGFPQYKLLGARDVSHESMDDALADRGLFAGFAVALDGSCLSLIQPESKVIA